MKLSPKNPCPFCGYLSTKVIHNKDYHPVGFQVECVNCGARGPAGMVDHNAAVMVWDKGDLDYNRPQLNNPMKREVL